jgi:hypothetical protein
MDLLPSSLSFRVVSTLDVDDELEVPEGFTGRVRRRLANQQRSITFLCDGLPNDPARSYPAVRILRPNGSVKYEMHYRDGDLHDPSPRTPAVRGFFANGVVHYEERYSMGRRHDGRDGTAALRKFRADGTLRHEIHYRHGVRLP